MASDEKTTSETSAPYTVRMTKEVSDIVQELLARTGGSSKDLFAEMIVEKRNKLIVETSPEQVKDMQQVRYHLSSIDSIYSGMAKKVVDITQDYTRQLEIDGVRHREQIEQLNEVVAQVNIKNNDALEKVRSLTDVLEHKDQQFKEMSDRSKSDRLTISILSQKIENLEEEVLNMPALRNRLLDHEGLINLMRIELANSKESSAALRQELDAMNREHDREIRGLAEVSALKLQHANLQIEAEVSMAKQVGKEEQIVLMREYNQLMKDHALLREKYAALIPQKT